MFSAPVFVVIWVYTYYRSKNPIWIFLLVPLPGLTRNQLQIEFGGTSIQRNKFNGTRNSEVVQ